MANYPQVRDLDDAYFRVSRNGKSEVLCFTDLTQAERDEVCRGQDEEWLTALAMRLAEVMRAMGDQLDITGINEDPAEEG